jgi:hypothetical protein
MKEGKLKKEQGTNNGRINNKREEEHRKKTDKYRQK